MRFACLAALGNDKYKTRRFRRPLRQCKSALLPAEVLPIVCAGGSSGIGLGLAEEFVKAGSTVIVTGRREGALKEAKEKLPSLHVHVSDVTVVDHREALAKWVVENFPSLNILVSTHIFVHMHCNAGAILLSHVGTNRMERFLLLDCHLHNGLKLIKLALEVQRWHCRQMPSCKLFT